MKHLTLISAVLLFLVSCDQKSDPNSAPPEPQASCAWFPTVPGHAKVYGWQRIVFNGDDQNQSWADLATTMTDNSVSFQDFKLSNQNCNQILFNEGHFTALAYLKDFKGDSILVDTVVNGWTYQTFQHEGMEGMMILGKWYPTRKSTVSWLENSTGNSGQYIINFSENYAIMSIDRFKMEGSTMLSKEHFTIKP